MRADLKLVKNNFLFNKKLLPSSAINWLKTAHNTSAMQAVEEVKRKWPNKKVVILDHLSEIYIKNERFIDAATCFKELLLQKNEKKNIVFNLAVALYKGGEIKESLFFARQSFLTNSEDQTIIKVLLECLLANNMPKEALKIAQLHASKRPNDKDYKLAISHSKRLMGDWAGSIEVLESLIYSNDEPQLRLMLADVYGEIDSVKALKIYESNMEKSQDFSPIYFYNLSLHYLRTRQFSKGWPLFEFGLKREIGQFGREIPHILNGTFRADLIAKPDPKNWTVICAEQGIGDQISFLSAMNEALSDYPKAILVCEERIASVIKRSFPCLQLITKGNIDGEIIANELGQDTLGYIPLGSMFAKYRPNIDSFLNHRKAFISVDGNLYHQYKSILARIAQGKKVIGISWRSQVGANTGKVKNSRFEDWEGVFDNHTLVVNLQYGNTQEEQTTAKERGWGMISFNQVSFNNELEHWLAIAAACDGIVSISTSLVHFAGACGQRVAVVMPYKQGHWTLGVSEKESIIYPNVRHFQPEILESFSDHIKRARQSLNQDQ